MFPALGCSDDGACMKWLCGIESKEGVYRCGAEFGHMPFVCSEPSCNSKNRPPQFGDTCYCGVYQIDESYWNDCHDPAMGYSVSIPNLNACSADEGCATECVQNYIRVSTYTCVCTSTCRL